MPRWVMPGSISTLLMHGSEAVADQGAGRQMGQAARMSRFRTSALGLPGRLVEPKTQIGRHKAPIESNSACLQDRYDTSQEACQRHMGLPGQGQCSGNARLPGGLFPHDY